MAAESWRWGATLELKKPWFLGMGEQASEARALGFVLEDLGVSTDPSPYLREPKVFVVSTQGTSCHHENQMPHLHSVVPGVTPGWSPLP